MALATIILAAGKGTRMKSDLPKVLHPVAHSPMVHHVMAAAQTLNADRRILVTGHKAELVSDAGRDFDPECDVVHQAQQLGTGHAVDQARAALAGYDGNVLVLYGDNPLFRPETLAALVAKLDEVDVAILGFDAQDPARYGRLVMDGDQLMEIVEFKDATEKQRAITLCNSGVMAASAKTMFSMLEKLENKNASGEYYLTDVVAHARAAGLTATAVICPQAETLGVDNRPALAQAEQLFQDRKRTEMLESGVSIQAPDTVHFAFDTVVEPGATIEQFVVFGPGAHVASNATVRAFSHVENAKIGAGAVVGPYARLRPGTDIGPDAKVGNFVEIKSAHLAEGAKVNHLSYVGDASIGARANIGAGTITCNYDGVFKHRTTVGADAFIGSNTMLVAPVSVGDNAMTASGSVITSDVPAAALGVARGKQINKPGFAKKLMDRLRAAKAAGKKGH